MQTIMDKASANVDWVDFIIGEREKRGWSQADPAEKIGSTRQTINNYESRRRTTPDEKLLVKISLALGYSALHLPRLAGLIPDEIKTDREIDDIVQALTGFSTDEKKEILAYINFLKNQRRKR